jgi:uncharacterized membrane protein
MGVTVFVGDAGVGVGPPDLQDTRITARSSTMVIFLVMNSSDLVNSNANHTANESICQPACVFAKISYNLSNMGMETAHLKVRVIPWKGLVYLAAGLVALGWLLNTPGGLLGKADAIGYAVCHRIDLRSFHLGDRQLPLCARCTGMFLGALLALGYQAWIAPRRSGMPNWKILSSCGILALGFAVDGVNSFLSLIPGAPTLYQPNNVLRLLTGTGMGIVIAIAVYPAFNQTAWKEIDNRPAVGNSKSFGGLIALGLGLDLLILSGNTLILYPLALASAASVLVMLMTIYTMVLLMLTRRENRYQNLSQVLPHIVGGFILALLQIALIDLGRYILTGTWDGFHLG